jgi:hypothetical protein
VQGSGEEVYQILSNMMNLEAELVNVVMEKEVNT